MLRLSNEKRGGKWELQRGAGTWERSVNLQRVWVSFHHHLCHPECHLNLRPPSPHRLMTCRAHYTQTNAQTPSCPNVCIPTVENKVEENSKFFYDEMLTVVQQILQTTAPFRRCGSNKTTLSDTRTERGDPSPSRMWQQPWDNTLLSNADASARHSGQQAFKSEARAEGREDKGREELQGKRRVTMGTKR